MRLILTIILLLTSSVAHGITYDPSVKDAEVLEFGRKHECVVVIRCLLNEDPKMYSVGSGVLIAPDVVVTAAHVVASGSTHEVISNGKIYRVSASVIHSRWNTKKFGWADIAVVFLKEPIEQEFYPKLYRKKDEVGKVCGIAGWGRYGTFDSGHSSSDGKRRAGSNIIDAIDREMLVVTPSKDGDGSRQTTLECLVSPGDSGGGLFIEGKLAGVHSILTTKVSAKDGAKLDGGWTNVSGSTRISIYVDWIENVIEQCRGHFKLIEQAQDAITKLKKLRD